MFLIVVEWFLIVIACFSKAETKQAFTKSKTLPCSVNENPIKAYQKTEVLNQNPMKIQSKPIRKQRFSIRIQWRSHQSLGKRKERICRNLTEALGRVGIFDILLQSRPPKKRKHKLGGTPLYYCRCNIILYYIYIYIISLCLLYKFEPRPHQFPLGALQVPGAASCPPFLSCWEWQIRSWNRRRKPLGCWSRVLFWDRCTWR